ncbi:GNAT family N-acetyltransferase [Actinomyces sp.]|uniref:GNAT family N-acetyltransferase n=1 Tax=Actinomyces sp. TaxID=29317 RepID=UPI0026DACD5E|nr:GNAT family N-acetyltransferase [Actinomyces sp.]MDO4900097.1 GNAT family N-acetyltransferase [Actinomyces sp.]
MSTITYRPYEPRDAEGVLAIINDAFHIHRYAPRPYLERSAADVFLADCLLSSSYAQVAVANDDSASDDAGKIMGVLMGRVEGESKLPGQPAAYTKKAASLAWLATAGIPQWNTLRQALDLKHRYPELRQDVLGTGAAALTDEVTVFAVHAACRGHGVGSRLYDDFMEHLRDHGRTDFFLYTDSLCNYEFYEDRGMVRAAAREQRLEVPGLPERVGVYLYAGQVPADAAASTDFSA